MSIDLSIVWFRQDLRLRDHPALYEACKRGTVLPLYILDDATPGEFRHGGASRWWLYHSLESLRTDLHKHHSEVILRNGDPKTVLIELAKETGADAIYWNRLYEPFHVERDKEIKQILEEQGVTVKSYNGSLLVEPWQLKTGSGEYYKVYTPFWKKLKAEFSPRTPFSVPTFSNPDHFPESDNLEDWDLLPTKPNWAEGWLDLWQPGEAGAEEALSYFIDHGLNIYDDARDIPAKRGTSRLSPHLHHGEISAVQIWHATQVKREQRDDLPDSHVDSFLSEIAWRDFSYNLLFNADQFHTNNFKSKFDDMAWQEDKDALKRWQQGQTGYPIVDAGMRELYATGWMHNRVRMIVASFLTKDLLIHWKEGAQWFHDTLVDADLASNSAGWQWSAGSGADAQPFFRIFNPVSQGEKFDPQGKYVRKWVPELSELSDHYIHKPWEADSDLLEQANIRLGKDYPHPIVDHKAAREKAMEAYQAVK